MWVDDDAVLTLEPSDLQCAAWALGEGWREHDEAALAGLTPELRREQVEARKVLYDYLDRYLSTARERDGTDVHRAPEWQAVAGMKHLLGQMFERALVAGQHDE